MNTKILQQLSKNIIVDQIGKAMLLPQQPLRIVCLVPSITELLYDLGLENRVVGITKFCVHPYKWFVTKQKIGGTKNVNIKKVLALNPNLIIASKEENVKEQIELLYNSYPVYTSDVSDLKTAIKMIADIGKITFTTIKANAIIKKTNTNFLKINKPTHIKKVVYLIWRNPYLTVGGDTFISAMLKLAGFKNYFAKEMRYPIITLENLKNKKIDVIFLSSEPYPFKEKHIVEIKNYLPNVKIIFVDGEMFSWYGSRLIKAPIYFNTIQNC
jgi:ABC-type Fe3+-hydroxamate transport system substrate-binding protein